MAYIDDLEDIRDNLVSVIKTETAYQAANGPKPSYSASGRAVSWSEWLQIMLQEVRNLDAQIAAQGEPFELVQRGYT